MAKEAREQELLLSEVTEEEYEKAVSKFITFPPKPKVGDLEYRDIEIGMIDWDTPGKSMKVPVTIVEEGADKGKEEKISFGTTGKGAGGGPGGIWKGREIYKAITGEEMPMSEGADGKMHPAVRPMALVGKLAVGVWQWQQGHPGGDTSLPPTYYPKLISILPAGEKPEVEDLGI